MHTNQKLREKSIARELASSLDLHGFLVGHLAARGESAFRSEARRFVPSRGGETEANQGDSLSFANEEPVRKDRF